MAALIGIMLSNVFVVTQSNNLNIIFPLIRDVVEYQAKVAPIGIVAALLCTEGSVSQDEAVNLMKYMSTRNVMIISPTSWQRFLTDAQNSTSVNPPLVYVLDLSCSGSTMVLEEANKKMMFTLRKRWFLLLKNQTFPKLDSYRMLLDSDVVVIYGHSRRYFSLEEVYILGKKLVRRKIGVWMECCGLTMSAPLVISIRRMNLQKTIIKAVVTVTRNETLQHLEDTLQYIDAISKVNIAVFNLVLDIINASADMIIVNSWGYSTNETWNGMTGYLQRGEADIGATPLFITKSRLRHVSYLPVVSPSRSAFIFRKPPLTTEENIFTLPFSRSAWLAATGLLTLIGIILYVIFRWEWKHNLSIRKTSWSDVALIIIGAICEQGSTNVARSTTGRIVTVMLFGATVYMYTAYSACIVALLQSSTNSIRTLENLLESNLEMGAFDIVYNRFFFSIASDPVRRAIYTRKIASPGRPEQFLSMEEGLKRVRNGRFAFHAEVGAAYKVISDTFLEEEKCGLDTINFLIEIVDPYVPVSKRTPYKEILTIAYLKVHETGLQNREHTKFYEKKPKCHSHDLGFIHVGLLECYPAFLILGCGSLGAIIMLLIEILTQKRMKCFKGKPPQSKTFIRRKNMLYLEKRWIAWDN